MYTVAREVTNIKKEFEGGNSLRVDFLSAIKQAADSVLDNVNPETLKRRVPIYGGLARGLAIYYCPADVEVPSDLYPNDGSRCFSYMPPAQFYRQQLSDKFTIEYINGVRFIVLRKGSSSRLNIIEEFESTTGIVGTGCTLLRNNHNFLFGTSSLEIVQTAAASNIVKTLDEAVSLTNYLRGIALVPIDIEDAADVVSIELQLISSVGNYYSMITTQDSIGDNLIDGWNQVRFDIANRAPSGSPTETITQFKLVITTTSGTQTFNVDSISLHETAQYYLEYYSNYMFVDGTTGGWKEEPEDGSDDLVNLNRDTAGILHYEACLIVTQQATFDRTDSQEEKKFRLQLSRKYDQYYARHPSSEMPLSYNISPDIPRDIPVDSGISTIGDYTITESDVPTVAFVSNENVAASGAMDGANTTYVLNYTPTVGSLQLYLNGAFQTLGVDYTLAGNVITMISPPPAVLPFVAFYRYET